MVRIVSTACIPSQYRSNDLYGPPAFREISVREAREQRQQYLEKRRQQYQQKCQRKSITEQPAPQSEAYSKIVGKKAVVLD